MLKLYEIVNLSESYTLMAPNFKTACIAVCLFGEGLYGVREIGDGEIHIMPQFVIYNGDQWFIDEFGKPSKEVAEEVPKSLLAEVMDSVLIGTPEERKFYEAARLLVPLDKQDKLKELYLQNILSKRFSLNSIAQQAQIWAKKLRLEDISKDGN